MRMPSLPDAQRIITDGFEFYAHSIFMEESNEVGILHASEQMKILLEKGYLKPGKSGRLWNRLILVNLVSNVCGRKTTADEAEALIHLNPHDWEYILQQLEECRSSIMKSNAGSYPPEGFDKEDEDMTKLPMFNEVYQEAHDLIRCHVVIAQFRQSLKTSSSGDVHAIIDEYTRNLPKSFQDTDLVAALRKDVLSSPKRKHNIVEKISQGVLEELQSTEKSYSFNVVQKKIKTLARTWNEEILYVPILARIGYGGVRATGEATGRIVDDIDNKTVSDFGMDERDEEEEREAALARKDLLRVRRHVAADVATAIGASASETGAEEYHTADEIDDEDDEDEETDRYNIKKINPMVVGKSKGHVQPLEIRPRDSWKADFELVDEIRDEDRAFPVVTDHNDNEQGGGNDATAAVVVMLGKNNDTDSTKRNLIVRKKFIWTDSEDDTDDEAGDCDDAEDEQDYRKTKAERKAERQKLQERRKQADELVFKRFLETDDDNDDALLPARNGQEVWRRPISTIVDDDNSDDDSASPTRKRKPDFVVRQDQKRRATTTLKHRASRGRRSWHSDDSDDDDNLPSFLKTIEISSKLPTYAECMQKKKDAAAATADTVITRRVSEEERTARKRRATNATSASQKTATDESQSANEKMKKNPRRIFSGFRAKGRTRRRQGEMK